MNTVEPDAGVRADAGEWFVGWVEDGERLDGTPSGARRSWGELILTSYDSDYDVRHKEDTCTSVEELDARDDPMKAREIARFDDDGGYRPMNGETTLPTGWVFPELDADGLFEVVGQIYPASIENRYLELNDSLDVTHWDETSERQTGIYADVEELRGEPLRSATEAFCASRCVKRREWEESGDKTIDSESENEGDFPCREACSLFVVGAREFVEQERGEKDDLPASDVEEPRRGELGDPANEYRVRYTDARREGVSGTDVR